MITISWEATKLVELANVNQISIPMAEQKLALITNQGKSKKQLKGRLCEGNLGVLAF